jgi:hypothetical protein
VQRDEALELVGEMRAPFGLALRERVLLEVVRVRKVVDARDHRGSEHLAIRRDAADRDAAEAHAVIGALAADEARALRFALRAMPRERDLEAVSTASEPELQKKTWSSLPGASSTTRFASSNASGCPIWKAGA